MRFNQFWPILLPFITTSLDALMLIFPDPSSVKFFPLIVISPFFFIDIVASPVLIAISSALLPVELMMEVQRRAALERGVTVPPMTDDTLRVVRIFSVLAGPLFVAVISFVFAALYTFVFVFVLGDQGRYRQYLALTVHAAFIPALLSLPLVPLRIQTGDPQFWLNLASFLFFLEPGYLLNVFRFMDLTQLWATAVTAWGVHEIDRKRSFGSAFVVLVGFMIAVALVFARFIPV